MTESTSTTEQESKGGRVVVLLVLGLALLFGGAYAGAYYLAGDKVPRGTTVAGVDIGGHRQGDAARILQAGLADRELDSIAVTAGELSREVTAKQAGFAVDYQATVADAGGEQSWHPRRLWSYFTGGGELDAVLTVDSAKLEALFDNIDERAGTEPIDAAIEFEAGKAKVTQPESGEALDRVAARAALEDAYLDEDPVAELPLVEAAPAVGQEALSEALESFANPAVSGPVTLVFGKSEVKLRPVDFGDALRLEPSGGALVPALDEERLAELVDAGVGDEGKPVDATVRIVNGKPKVIKAKPGVSYEISDISATFLDLVTRPPGKRSEKVQATVAEPEFTTKDARALGIKEEVSSFTTHYPHATYRNVNIGRAAEIIDGTILKPGEVFSLNDIVGERTAANGFTRGFMIANGIFKQDYGGGVSQVATTVFNAMFFAGLKDIEHKPHSFYISRYPVGREATVAWGSIDLRFENDTDYGVLIQSFINPSTPGSQGSITVRMWSTKVWDITTSTSDRYNHTQHKTREITAANCEPNSGYGGFDVDVKRYFHKPGSDEVVRTENFHTTYTPSDTVICKKPEPPKQDRPAGGGTDEG